MILRNLFEKSVSIGSKFSELFMSKGDIKYLILYELRNKKIHGYEIMNAIKKEFLGVYSPSPGTIYPSLQMLEEQGLIKSEVKGSKKVYSITDDGRKFLKENKKIIMDIIKSVNESKIIPQIKVLSKEFGGLAKETINLAILSAKENKNKIKNKVNKTSSIIKETMDKLRKTWQE